MATHDITPFGFAQREDTLRPSRFAWRENGDIDLDLGSVLPVVHDAGAHLPSRRAEEIGADAKREAAAESFEVRADDAAEEVRSLVAPGCLQRSGRFR